MNQGTEDPMKKSPLVAAVLILLLIVTAAVPATAGVCMGKKNSSSDKSCSIASLEQDPVCEDRCPVLSALAEDNVCTADDPAGVLSVVCTVGSAMYKGAKTAAFTGAKLALTATTMIVSGLVQLGSLISPA
jgi:hypothetical protein